MFGLIYFLANIHFNYNFSSISSSALIQYRNFDIVVDPNNTSVEK